MSLAGRVAGPQPEALGCQRASSWISTAKAGVPAPTMPLGDLNARGSPVEILLPGCYQNTWHQAYPGRH